MKKQELSRLQELARQVGDFIRYWGFRKIHGEIWTVIYLSARPLSGVEIVGLLRVSKALVSPALKELEHEGLISQVESENSKTKRYAAVEDVTSIIRGVLVRREWPMISKIKACHGELENHVGGDTANHALDSTRMQSLGAFIHTADIALSTLVDSEAMWN